jgi:hypothetical protein
VYGQREQQPRPTRKDTMDTSVRNVDKIAADLSPDRIIALIPARSRAAVALVGYLGEGTSAESVRLYESVALDHWIEIPTVAIVHRVSGADAGAVTDGQSVVWVKREALLVSCESVSASSFEGPPVPDTMPLKWPRP